VSSCPIVRAWNDFFFCPERPTPIALFRILYGVIVTANLALLRGDWFVWYGSRGFTTGAVAHRLQAGRPFGPIFLFPSGDSGSEAFFWILLFAAICLTIGFLSRVSAITVFLAFLSLHHRNPTILNGADALMKIIAFFLMFAPCGAAISVDRLIRICRGQETSELRSRIPWAQRMIQIELSVLYISTFWWKAIGHTWLDGTATYYALHLGEFRHFPVPDVQNIWIIRFMTWSTLVTEFSMGVLVWFKEYRRWALLAGVCLHLSIEYALNIPLFQWLVMATYVTFIRPEELSRAWACIRARVGSLLGHPTTVFCDESSPAGVRLMHLLKAVDIFGRLCVESRPSAGEPLLVVDEGVYYMKFAALLQISTVIPLLWPLTPFRFLASRAQQIPAVLSK